jgi:hypothetical protein
MKKLAFIALLATLTACASGDKITAPAGADAAASAVSTFSQLADSVSRSGGDTALSGAYAALAEAIRQGGRVSRISITLDGAPTEFIATAQLGEFTSADAALRVTTLRSMIAFRASDPRQVVQLSSSADSDPIRAYLYPVLVPFNGPSASLIYMDGKGGIFFGTSGTQKFAVTTSETPCTATGDRIVIAIYPAPPKCTQADFSVSFNGTTEPSSFLTSRNTATGSHTLSMSAQGILGARFQVTAPSIPVAPPIGISPSGVLPATVSARIDSLVTLTFSVSNPTSAAVDVLFNSGQRFDFTITDASNGAVVWRWSDGLGFTGALGSVTIPAGGSVTYSASWRPTRRGTLVATGMLASTSHKAITRTIVTLP